MKKSLTGLLVADYIYGYFVPRDGVESEYQPVEIALSDPIAIPFY